MTSEEKRIMGGLLFRPGDPELKALNMNIQSLLFRYWTNILV